MTTTDHDLRPDPHDNDRRDSASDDYRRAETAVRRHLRETPIPEGELLENLYMFLTPQHLRRVLFFYELYRRIRTVPGVVMQLGVRWGRDLALWEALRTTFEPFHHARTLVGFDTFTGFGEPSPEDGAVPMARAGNFATAEGYEHRLAEYLRAREALSPLPHVEKFRLVKGDASETLPAYLEAHPETVVALAHFDMDLYRPTRDALERLKPHLTKGSIVVMDELGLGHFPGETIALREVFGLDRVRLERHPDVNPTWPAFFVIE